MTSVQIRQFLSVAKYMNFSKAANALYISQPALSKQIQKLEEELGFALFDRSTHEVCLTPAGETMHRFFDAMAAAYDLTCKKARQQSSGSANAITIGIQDNSGYDAIIARITSGVCDVGQSLVIEFYSHEKLLEYLHTGYIDLALTRYEPDELSGEFEARELEMNEDLVLINAKGSLALCEKMDADLFSGHILCVPYLHDDPAKDSVAKMLRYFGITPSEVKAVPNLETALFMVNTRDAVIFADEHLTVPKSGDYKTVRTGFFHSTALIWRRDNPNPAVRRMAQGV